MISDCSAEGFFELSNYTNSNVELPGCYPQNSNAKDVWFKFVNTFENVNIICRGDVGQGKGGTLQDPQIAFYKGSCGALVNEGCNSDFNGLNVVEITIGDLELGEEYFIRIGSRSNHEGTFQLCFSNFCVYAGI